MSDEQNIVLTPSQSWAYYYNEWFGADKSILMEILDAGETSLPRALNRYHQIVYSTKKTAMPNGKGGIDYTRKEIDHSNEQNLLPTGKPVFITTRMLGELVPLPFYVDADGYASRYLMDIVLQDQPQAIVEIGSGDGVRLFELDTLGIDRDIRLYAAEQSEHAREIISTLSRLDPNVNITAHEFSFENPDFSYVQECDSILVFSFMSLMFNDKLDEDYIVALSQKAKKVKFIHFEPFGHQFSAGTNIASREQAEYFAKKQWNMNFIEVLVRLHDEGTIKNFVLAKDVCFTRDPHTPNCILTWECF